MRYTCGGRAAGASTRQATCFRGTNGCVEWLLNNMADLIVCSGCDRKHHPVHGTNRRVHWLLNLANLIFCSGCDPKHHPVHGTDRCVEQLLHMADRKYCRGTVRRQRQMMQLIAIIKRQISKTAISYYSRKPV